MYLRIVGIVDEGLRWGSGQKWMFISPPTNDEVFTVKLLGVVQFVGESYHVIQHVGKHPCLDTQGAMCKRSEIPCQERMGSIASVW